MGRDDPVEVDPPGHRRRTVGGEHPWRRLEQANARPRHLDTEERGTVVEPDKIDLGGGGGREARRKRELVMKGKLGVHGQDRDIEIAGSARPPRRPRAEEDGQPERRAAGQGRSQAVAYGVVEVEQNDPKDNRALAEGLSKPDPARQPSPRLHPPPARPSPPAPSLPC